MLYGEPPIWESRSTVAKGSIGVFAMNMYELNKILGAVLGAALLVMVVNEIGNALVHPVIPERIAIAVGDGEPEAKEEKSAEMAKESAGAADLASLLAAADADKGAKVAKKCKACHSFEKDGKHKVGPLLYGVVGRAMGAGTNFNYSAAMKEKGGTWSYAELDAFLADPKAFLPGTKMSFKGVSKETDRANLIAYMRQNHDSPPPLPGQ